MMLHQGGTWPTVPSWSPQQVQLAARWWQEGSLAPGMVLGTVFRHLRVGDTLNKHSAK